MRGMDLALAILMILMTGCGTVLTPLPLPTATLGQGEAAGATPTAAMLAELYVTPLPPTPTFTPSPSPTPVIHIVESGDTLFGIALEYGVDASAVQTVNDLDNPNALRIGQSLIIPLSPPQAAEMVPIPGDNLLLPTPTPLPLETAGVGLHPTAVGGLWCMGEVINDTSSPVTNMQVQVTLVDASGNPLLTEATLAAADYLQPGARAPFAVLFESPPPGVADAVVRLRRAEGIGAITANFLPLSLDEVRGAISGPQYRVSGQLLNDAGGAVSRIVVVVTLYDTQQRVIGYREAHLTPDPPLAPGATIDFSVLLTPRGGEEPADFNAIAWGNRG